MNKNFITIDDEQPEIDQSNQSFQAMTDAITFIYCASHDAQYPQGATCPLCTQVKISQESKTNEQKEKP